MVRRATAGSSISEISFRLAPAWKLSAFPEMKMIPRIPRATSSSRIISSKPMNASSVQVFILSPATSITITSIPESAISTLKTLPILHTSSSIYPDPNNNLQTICPQVLSGGHPYRPVKADALPVQQRVFQYVAYKRRKFGWSPQTFGERHRPGQFPPHTLRKPGHHRGIDQTRRNRHYPDSVIGAFPCYRKRHPNHAGLGGAVRGLPDLTFKGSYRRGIDDHPSFPLIIRFIFCHLLDGKPSYVKGANQVYIYNPREKIKRQDAFFRKDLTRIANSCAIDSHIDCPECRHRLPDSDPAAFVAGNIGADKNNVRPQFRCKFFTPFRNDIKDSHPCTLGGQHPHAGLTHTGSSPGNNSNRILN